MTRSPDQIRAFRLAAIMAVCGLIVIGLLAWGLITALPSMQAWVDVVFSSGLGLKSASIIAAGVSFLVLIVLAVTAGDGIIGEIQFLIPGFFLFFMFFWLMIAWVF